MASNPKQDAAVSPLARLPSMTSVIQHPDVASLIHEKGRTWIVERARELLADLRTSLTEAGDGRSKSELTKVVAIRLRQACELDRSSALDTVINATGILLHTNLGRAPLAPNAIDRVRQAAGYANIEIDLESGKRSKRGLRCTSLIRQYCGSEDAIVVNNCAAATLLALAATASGRKVLISRSQLVEIGGGFRLPEVFEAAGVALAEVGTTNRTYVRDYQGPIASEAAAIMRVHRSNFALSGFCTEPTTAELSEVAHSTDIPMIDDLGSGMIVDLPHIGDQETLVHQSVSSGADLTLFSGDKLLGGPQCGIIVGRQKWIECLRKHPLMRAMRVCKLTLAALEATLELYMSERLEQIPLHAMLSQSEESLRETCKQVVASLSPRSHQIEIVETSGFTGGGTLPGKELPSVGITISPSGNSLATPEQLATILRRSQPAIVGRVNDDRLVLDLRTVLPEQLGLFSEGLQRAIDIAEGEA